ncbi:MAG TPA: secretin N-terminal domain-containing protein [Planctomycetaceae bacterium]|jgi:type II secretion system protein D|nr:secretin N-terminal domain-containing protein [Planctomycetaceae bacterium]
MASHRSRFEPKCFRVAGTVARCFTIAGLIWVSGNPAVRAQADSNSSAPSSGATRGGGSAGKSEPDGRVRLNMQAASWSKVLKRIARHGGMELVMKSSPPGTFSCSDSSDHTIPDALRLVNGQLEALGYRAIPQGKFLVVLNLDGMRAGYNIPAFMRQPRNVASSGGAAGQADSTHATAAPGSESSAGSLQTSATDQEANSVRAVAPALMELNADGNAEPGAGSHGAGSHGADIALSAAESVHLSGEADPTTKEPAKKSFKQEKSVKQEKSPQELREEKIAKADTTPQIRIFFVSSKWPEVLESLCEQSGLTLVAKKCPSGTVNFRDWKKHTTGEVISVLNHELEEDQSSFRLVRQENFLLVVNKDDLRSEYERPVVGRRRPVHSVVETITESRPATVDPAGPQPSAPARVILPATLSGTDADDDAPRARTIEPVRLESAPDAPELLPAPTALEVPSNAPTGDATPRPARRAEEIFAPSPAPSSSGTASTSTSGASGSAFTPQHRRVEALSRRLYSALKARSELLDAGPENLPSFRVFDAAGARSRVACTIGIDTEHNRLVIEAPAKKRSALLHVFAQLDATDSFTDDNLRLVSADLPQATIAQNVTSELNKFIVQNPPIPSPQQAPGRATLQVTPGQPNLSELIKGLKGEVTVESVPELGILILRGNPTDVDAVMKVIREVERLSAGAAPQITILPLQYVNSDSFAKLMSQVYSDLHGLRTSEAAAKPQIKFYAIGKPNAVLVIAPPAEMNGVRELASQLDKPVLPETEFQVFPLRHGIAAQIAKSVNDFYKGRSGLGTVVSAVSDARTNSVIVQARPRDLEEVAKLIAKLDGPTASQATVKVFTLTHGDAATIVRLLTTLFLPSGQQQGGGATQTAQTSETSPTILRITADVRTNSIIAVGAPETLQAIYAVILRLDNTDAHQRQTVVIKLKNNSSDAVAKAISDFVSSERAVSQLDPDLVSTVELLEREVFIVSEAVSNSLLLSATPRYFDELKKMIDKLDAPPTQVVIQAMIVEVTLTNDDEFGIELGFQSPVLFDRSTLGTPVTFTTISSQNTNTTVQNQINLSTPAAPGFQFSDPALGTDGLGTNSIVNKGTVGTQELTNLGVTRLSTVNPQYGSGLVLAASSESVSFLLRALSYRESVHILSRPMIRTVDNQDATVQVGKNVPIITGFIPVGTTGALAPIVRQDGAGIILEVLPRITPDGMIVMKTSIEKSLYEPGNGVVLVTDPVSGRTITSPIKDVTRAVTTVSLASGETVVMGGLITSNEDTVERKVPWVGDVPILGQLFRYDTKTTERKELLIFLTPRVIRSDADDEMLKQIETDRLHFLLDEAESIHGPILSQPSADGLMQQCPPLTMPQSQLPGSVPPAPGVAPSITAPPSTIRPSQQPGMPPELPPAVSPAPGVPPVRPGVAPPIPREMYLDDPSVPTTQMPSDTLHDVKPLRTFAAGGHSFGQRAPAADQSGTVRFPFQPSDADSGAVPPAPDGK